MVSNQGISLPGKGEISKFAISTAFGTDGRGIFPYTFWPSYRKLLKNVVVDLKATVISKPITYNPRLSNYGLGMPKTWRFIEEIKNKFLMNAYGLANKGAVFSAKEITETICDKKVNLIPSLCLCPKFPKDRASEDRAIEEILESIRLFIAGGAPLWAIELNFFCPKPEWEVSENMRASLRCVMAVKERFSGLVVIAKTSIVHPFSFYRQLEDAGVDVIHGFNTIPFELAFSTDSSSWANLDRSILFDEEVSSRAKRFLSLLRKETSLPLIMGWNVTSFKDVDELFNLGANVVSICTLALTDPEEARTILLVRN